jgi:hypothetical protein
MRKPSENHMETMGFDGDFFGDFSKKNGGFLGFDNN